MIPLGDLLAVLVLENSSTTKFHSLFGSICINVVIWEAILNIEEFLSKSDGVFWFWRVWLILALLLVSLWSMMLF